MYENTEKEFDKILDKYSNPTKAYTNSSKDNQNKPLSKIWNILDNGNIVTILLIFPLSLFLISAYFNEEIVKITMPFFLSWSCITWFFLTTHAIKRRVFRFFDRGPVFLDENPIKFWILISINYFLSFVFFVATLIYIIDNYK